MLFHCPSQASSDLADDKCSLPYLLLLPCPLSILLDGQRTRLITDPLGRPVFSVWHLCRLVSPQGFAGSAIVTSTNAAHSYICAYNIYHFPYSSLLVSVFWDRLITKVKLLTYSSKGIKPVNTFFFLTIHNLSVFSVIFILLPFVIILLGLPLTNLLESAT